MILAAGAGNPLVLIELGAVLLGLALLARLSARVGLSAIPLYLVAGVMFGEGGLTPLALSQSFIETGSAIGVVLLLLALGLEYTADDLLSTLRGGSRAGLLDLVLNATPGAALALVLGWGATAAVVLGGVTYISSSGVIAKVLADLGRVGNRETPAILGVLVIEDLAMAAYLPLLGVLLAPTSMVAGALTLGAALVTVAAILLVAVRAGPALSRLVASESDEALLLTVLGATLLVAGVAEEAQVSSAVGAFLVGIALSGPVSERAAALLNPLRDVFAATFFLFFGLQIDPASIPPVLLPAVVLGVVTAATKVVTGRWAARQIGAGPAGQRRAGLTLIARGEFSIVIAGLATAAGVGGDVGPLAATYVLLMAAAAPVVARLA